MTDTTDGPRTPVDPSRVDAVILVGGKGTRLRPLTLSAPKPMLPTAGLPFLTHLLSRIAATGIEHVVLGTAYKAETFEAEFGDGSKLGLQIDYVVEEVPLGTGGGIANVASKLRNDTVMVFNGDVLSGADLGAMLASHHEQDADLTLHLVRVSDPRAFGSVPTDGDGNVGVPGKTEDPPTDQINAGTHIFKRSIIDRIPLGREVSVERESLALLADRARCAAISTCPTGGTWAPGGFRPRLGRPCPQDRPSPALVGQRGRAWCTTEPRWHPAPWSTAARWSAEERRSVPGCDSTVRWCSTVPESEPGAVVERSIIGFGSRIGPRALIRDGVIGDGADIGARCGVAPWRPGVARRADSRLRYPLLQRHLMGSRDRAQPAQARSAPAGSPSIGHHRRSSDSSLRTGRAPAVPGR